jgi:putative tryptophan/tyrosine transport system substrate-binding protein
MRRRDFIAGLSSVAALPFGARAQQPTTPVIGILLDGFSGTATEYLQNFRDGMRELGYEDKRNVKFEYRFADGHLDRLPMLAGELIDLNPSVIVSAGTMANLAARRATRAIPVVMASGADPVGFGLIASHNRPSGNVTGLANFAELLVSKQIELLRELMPRLSRVGVLINPNNPLHVPQLKESQAAAAQVRLYASFFEIHAPEELDSTFAAISQQKFDGLIVPPDYLFLNHRRHLADLASSFRMATIYGYREHVVEGGLMSYGPNLPASYRRAATYVDKILRGAQPADLPVEQPTKFDLTINLKTAKALGLIIPETLLATADEVIQ